MSQILVIAEKPSMAADIANAIGVMHGFSVSRHGLYHTVGNYTVVGAQGHLYSLKDAEAYGPQFAFPWKLDPLPVFPDKFELELNVEKKLGKVVNSSLTQSIRTRVAKIKELIANADEVIHAGDPDREGQLIIDNVLREMRFRGPVNRLWLHAQTLDGIMDALRKMKSNATYKNLGLAAIARSESDWAIGINGTRAFTSLWWKKGHKGVLNIGRVTTPVIGMLVSREKEIDNFVPIDHFTMRANIHITGESAFWASWIKPEGEGKPGFDASGKLIIDSAMVAKLASSCNGKKAQIVVATKTPKKEGPPLLFSLTELQKTAAKAGISPADTLKAAQSLYEKHKLTSYPRTECQYAPESEHLKSSKVIDAILKNYEGTQIPAGWSARQKSKSWDDKKLAEHYAIIPLAINVNLATLSANEKWIYKLICYRYLAQFFPDYEYIASVVVAQVETEKFKATGSVPVKEGWKILYGGSAKGGKADEEDQDNLPSLTVGQIGIAKPVELVSKKTEPPKRFTSITLLEAMEKAHLFVTDPKVKAMLKQVQGLGTAATRAETILKIVLSGFALEELNGRVTSYAPTPKAFSYIESVPANLAKPDLTAWFEGKLEELASGTLQYPAYTALLKKLVCAIVDNAKDPQALERMPAPSQMPDQVFVKKSPAKKRSSGFAAKKSAPRRKRSSK